MSNMAHSAKKSSKVRFNEDRGSLKSSLRKDDGAESFESFQSLVAQEIKTEKIVNHIGKGNVSDPYIEEVSNDENDPVLLEFGQQL